MDIVSTGTLRSRDIMYKNSKHPGTFQIVHINYGDVMTKNHHIFGDVMNKGHTESKDILIQGGFVQRGTL